MMSLEGVDTHCLPLPRHLQMNSIYISVAFSFGDWSLRDDGIGGCGSACQGMQHSPLTPLMFPRHLSSKWLGEKQAYQLLTVPEPHGCPWLTSRACALELGLSSVQHWETKVNKVLVKTIPVTCNHHGWTLDQHAAFFTCKSSFRDSGRHPVQPRIILSPTVSTSHMCLWSTWNVA